MKEFKFQRWMHFKEMQDIATSLKVLDGYNKTRFNRKFNKGEDTLLESAKYAHNNDMVYFVTVLENDIPISHLEVNKAFFRVYFLDELNRNYMSYDFIGNDLSGWRVEIPKDKLFLSKITVWTYENDGDKKINISDYIFRPNGQVTIIERNLLTNERIEKQAKDKIDISANWEDYPKFGEYDNLIQKERGVKLFTV